MTGQTEISSPFGPLRVLVVGGTGSAGRATVGALAAAGHEVVAIHRPGSRPSDAEASEAEASVEWRPALVTERASLFADGFRGEKFDAVVSCLASRSGRPSDAWAIDHDATVMTLELAREHGASHVVLLSAICVQKPRLAFQHAKLAAEAAVKASGLRWSIVRPTAFFKSLSGQIERVRAGKPFLVFGDGQATSCKPISDRDLGKYISDCLTDPARWDRLLPIGGPGPAITPRDQGEILFDLTGRPPRFRHVPHAVMDLLVATLGLAGRLAPGAAAKAEFARIGRYYARESMLVLDPETGLYDAGATPETGRDRLSDHYADVLSGRVKVDLKDHAAF